LYDLGESRGTVCVGDVPFFRRIHDIAAAPQIVESIVDADLANSMFVGEVHATLHGVEGYRLAELFLRIPYLGGIEETRLQLDLGSGNAAAGTTTKQVVEMQRLDRVVRPNAMRRGHLAKTRRSRSFIGREAAIAVSGIDERVVLVCVDNKKLFHRESSDFVGLGDCRLAVDEINQVLGRLGCLPDVGSIAAQLS
jgi:hypothetical protein